MARACRPTMSTRCSWPLAPAISIAYGRWSPPCPASRRSSTTTRRRSISRCARGMRPSCSSCSRTAPTRRIAAIPSRNHCCSSRRTAATTDVAAILRDPLSRRFPLAPGTAPLIDGGSRRRPRGSARGTGARPEPRARLQRDRRHAAAAGGTQGASRRRARAARGRRRSGRDARRRHASHPCRADAGLAQPRARGSQGGDGRCAAGARRALHDAGRGPAWRHGVDARRAGARSITRQRRGHLPSAAAVGGRRQERHRHGAAAPRARRRPEPARRGRSPRPGPVSRGPASSRARSCRCCSRTAPIPMRWSSPAARPWSTRGTIPRCSSC